MSYQINIIIPARNEEKVIIKTLKNLKKYVKQPHKIIIVNDKSTDKTSEVVKNYSLKNKNIKLINNTTKKSGFGHALKLGYLNVKRGPIVYVMADLCDDPKTIDKMYLGINEGWDIVCGSRYMKGGKKNGGPIFQGIMSKLINLSLYNLLAIPTSDTSNAFKMYTKEILSKIKFNEKSGVEASMELLSQAYFKGAKITEIPTSWTGRTIGSSKFKIMQRSPRYGKIYLWIFKNSIKKMLGQKLVKFYI